MTRPVTPRAVGERIDYDAMPQHLREWVELTLGGRVVSAITQVGGMSPGPAVRLVLETGERWFLKAVGSALNPVTPRLFRRELTVLERLPAASYRPALRASMDDGDWVLIVLGDVEGRHPDLDDPVALAAVRDVVREQSRSLTPDPVALEGEHAADAVRRWCELIARPEPHVRELLPHWWLEHEDDLLARLESLPTRLPSEAWCHFDIRDDNMLQRPDGTAVIVDWGMSRSGPAWVDEVLLDLHSVTDPVFDERVAMLPSYGVASDHDREDTITDFVLALGMSLAVISHGPSPEGLPRLMSFRRREADRLLIGAGRRLGLT